MKKCDLMNQLKEGAPKGQVVCCYCDHTMCEACISPEGDCPYRLTEKTEREKLIEEAEQVILNKDGYTLHDDRLAFIIHRLIAFIKKDGSNV